MENLKELVKFNRYKSVESFNNATDVTSSTISIVKLGENVMDIYLGRTQLTHSNFPEVSVELRNLINSLDSKLNSLKTEFNSNLSSIDEKHKKELSKYITDFESGLIDLVSYTDDLSKEISDIKSDIKKKFDSTNQQVTNISKSISDISVSLSEQTKTIDKLTNKISEDSTKQISAAIDIKNLKQDVVLLKAEDTHIFDIISGITPKLGICYWKQYGVVVLKQVFKNRTYNDFK